MSLTDKEKALIKLLEKIEETETQFSRCTESWWQIIHETMDVFAFPPVRPWLMRLNSWYFKKRLVVEERRLSRLEFAPVTQWQEQLERIESYRFAVQTGQRADATGRAWYQLQIERYHIRKADAEFLA